ncbi:MAG: glutamine--fructose-6-phosphate transaminase (isomerizing) [Dehalococcoidia bacterium]
MCGIIGYCGKDDAGETILRGLKALEYRGYDSSGIALADQNGSMSVTRSVGKISALIEKTKPNLISSSCGIGHTRWATHGAVNEANTHPHTDQWDKVAIVHNGIIENFEELKENFAPEIFTSETDTEVIAHMIALEMDNGENILHAVQNTLDKATGSFSIVVLSKLNPQKIIAARKGNASGLVVGFAKDAICVVSDITALTDIVEHITFLDADEYVEFSSKEAIFYSGAGEEIDKKELQLPFEHNVQNLGQFKHYMLKEINEQPEAILDTIRGRYQSDTGSINLEELQLSSEQILDINRVVFVGMGTSSNATLVGRHYMERFAKIPSEVDNASEFRYRQPILDKNTLVISVAQSGETVDTLAAMDEAKRAGCMQITICNNPGTQTTRIADSTLYIRCGQEISVASTKTMTASMVLMHALALYFGKIRGTLPSETEQQQINAVLHLPVALGQALELSNQVEEIASRYHSFDDFLFLGRGLGFPIAIEGALKLKEISYINAIGYAAGEMKHGPIALIDSQMPTIAIAPRDTVFEKMVSNIQQIRARQGKVIALVSHGEKSLNDLADEIIELPEIDPLLSPIVTVVPLQLLAYHIAQKRGLDIDQPRNLAKTVTVE